ncbi:MAG: DUF5674 family protein [Lachnospiraceae bacterium]|nr:DUF5674 family protein [Lachnospiraceae bacterium]
MNILKDKISKEKLLEYNKYFSYMVKGVLDIEKELVAINADLHSDLEELLLDNGSDNRNLYGFNILFDDFEIEYDSIINIPRNRDLGYPRGGRTVMNQDIRNKMEEIIKKWIEI